jgi:fibro-slime domain-containing protein
MALGATKIGFAALLGSALFPILGIVGCGGENGAPAVDGGSNAARADSAAAGPSVDASTADGASQIFGAGQDAPTTTNVVPDACAGSSCFDGPVCGDGIVEAGETCDDGNSTPGDGCSGVCQVEPGYSCPTQGQPCLKVWVCGNGIIDPGETCDDANTTSGDGCSSTCQAEPGWTCPAGGGGDAGAPEAGAGDGGTPGGVCTQNRCGDGIVQTGESCDDGNSASGDGCSATCQIEKGWQCPTAGAACTAAACGDGVVAGAEQCDDGNATAGDGCGATCQVEPGWQCPTPAAKCLAKACGDGIVAGAEQCDDGNTTSGDGCSATCKLEPGYACTTRAMPPQSACHNTVCSDAKTEGFEECDDGNLIPYDGCSPTCTIEPKCKGGTCSAVCGDGLKFPQEACDDGNTISGDGCSATCTLEPGWTCSDVTQAPPASLVIPVLYRDMLYAGTTVAGQGHPDFQSFITGVVHGLVQSQLGADNEPVWKSNGLPTTALSGPTEFCWWFHETGCSGAQSVNPYDKLVYLDGSGHPTTLTLAQQGTANVYQFNNQVFYPLDNLGYNAGPHPQTGSDCNGTPNHNFSFTSELHYPFTYIASAPVATFDFTGDDDVYGFINGQLVIDLGGVHSAARASVSLDATTAATLGLVDGGMYSIDMFQAERHTCASTYKLTLAGFVHVVSQCTTVCGDGVVAGTEQCDNGTNDGSYGTCNANCTLAPYCGDDKVQNPPEQCDDGSNLTTYAASNASQCGPGCKWAPYCGDGAKNGPEACDNGANNQSPSLAYGASVCTTACTLAPYCGDGVPESQFGEQCDNGKNDGSYGSCNANCTLAPYCGDGVTNGPEQCDNGAKNVPLSSAYGPGLCTTECTVGPYCGDGVVQTQFGEQCDGTPGCGANCKNGTQ